MSGCLAWWRRPWPHPRSHCAIVRAAVGAARHSIGWRGTPFRLRVIRTAPRTFLPEPGTWPSPTRRSWGQQPLYQQALQTAASARRLTDVDTVNTANVGGGDDGNCEDGIDAIRAVEGRTGDRRSSLSRSPLSRLPQPRYASVGGCSVQVPRGLENSIAAGEIECHLLS